eukprot:2329102-Rhodomonas_salina.1
MPCTNSVRLVLTRNAFCTVLLRPDAPCSVPELVRGSTLGGRKLTGAGTRVQSGRYQTGAAEAAAAG